MAQYKVGTVSVTLNSDTVTGSGTAFLANVAVGDWFSLQGVDHGIYTVKTVDSDTQLTIIGTYGGATASGQTYWTFTGFSIPDNLPIISEGDVDTHRIMARLAVKTQELFNATVTTGVGELKDLSDVDSALAPNNNDVLKYNSSSAEFESAPVGSAPIDNLTDVTITAVAEGEILQMNASSLWVNQTFAEADIASASALTAHAHAVDDLTDLTVTALTNNEILQYNTSNSLWENQTFAEADIASAATLAAHTHTLEDASNVNTGTVSTGDDLYGESSGVWSKRKNEIAKTVDPTSAADYTNGYRIGSRWVNIITDEEFVLVHSTGSGDAVWKSTTSLAAFDTHEADGSIHFAQGDIIHSNISQSGTTSHADLDTHYGDSTIHYTQAAISITESQISDFQVYSLSTHTHAFNDLTDIDTTGIADGQVMKYNASALNFQPASDVGITDHTALSNIGTNTHAQLDNHLADSTIHFTQAAISITESQISDLQTYSLSTHNHTLDSLSNVTVTTIADGEALTWNASALNWENSAIPTDHTALTSIGVNTHAQIDTHIADSN